MSTAATESTPASSEPILAWERHAGPTLSALPAETPRVVVIGAAGAGKSLALRHLRALVEHSRPHAMVAAPAEDLARVPREDVLVVDDLHLLHEDALRALHERASDPAVPLIAATRPGPLTPTARALVRLLERDTPPIVLGHVSHSDLVDHLAALNSPMPEPCVRHILRETAGVAWLVVAALQHHDPRDCSGDSAHRELQRALAELVAHRLDTADPAVQLAVERFSVGGRFAHLEEDGELLLRGYAEGLLLRGGDVAPVVRSAVRRFLPIGRLVSLSAALPDSVAQPDELRRVTAPVVASSLAARADRVRTDFPTRAAALYDAAIECGAAPQPLAERRAEAAWAAGRLDACAAVIDSAGGAGALRPDGPALRLSAAVWAARGMLAQADAVYRSRERIDDDGASAAVPAATDPLTRADAEIAAVGVGSAAASPDPEGAAAPRPAEQPTTLDVALALLHDGVRQTLAFDVDETALTRLVRAAELYTASGTDGALCEPPAVIAAIVALALGRPATAGSVLSDALEGGHSGGWARRRLLLWAAWTCVQRAQLTRAMQLVAQADDETPWTPRDRLLRHAVEVAVARRQDDGTALRLAWQHAAAALQRVDVDLYLLHPVMEMITAATALGDAARVAPHRGRALDIVSRLGEPPLWSSHVHWAGVQQGILTSSPAALAPHARALVASAPHGRVAAGMARAGRVWTDVLAGSVDAPVVVAAAKSLASVGLLWDAARLAGHAAARSSDRRVAAQLLACARDLHPSSASRTDAAGPSSESDETSGQLGVLSDREIEVARLVMQGKTYAEIGAKIFISPRTAEHHIAHIRRRLGAQTRSELLARLRELFAAEQGTAPPHATPVDRGRAIGGSPDAAGTGES